MGEFEEETYSTVFKALKHPVRRRLLRVLAQDPHTFTDLQNEFKVNGAVLTYHLESMKDLICKTADDKYSLSTMGEGAIALMERVEEPPKVTPRTSSPKNSRRLNILQVATVSIAVVLLVSGIYLASISAVETFYDLHAGWTAGGTLTHIGGNLYNTTIYVFVKPPDELFTYRGSDICVGFDSIERISAGAYNITLPYLDQSRAEDVYIWKQLNYSGEFLPVEDADGIVFSTRLALPFYLRADQAWPVPLEFTITIWTNATYPDPPEPKSPILPIVKAPVTDEFYSETRRPYENQGNIITIIGTVLVVSILMLQILPLLGKQTRLSVSTQSLALQQ